MSQDEAQGPNIQLHSPVLGGQPSREENNDLPAEPEEDSTAPSELLFANLVRARQTTQLPLPRTGEPNLPLDKLDPEVLERLAAEMIKRRPNLGAHFYGRRGQKQHGLDILEREAADANTVYQVRRYEILTPDDITSAVTEYADPPPPKGGGTKPARRFVATGYVLFTSAEFETETALQDRLEELQRQYAGDLIIRVWGREMISGMLRDSGALVGSVFGPDWARVFCGFAPPPPPPGDPDPLGLVESPIQVLNLSAMASDANARESGDPLESARLNGMIADTLAEANFPSHAAVQRRRQAQLLQTGGDYAAAFAVLFDLARADFTAGATRMLGPIEHDLDALKPHLDELQGAKLAVLAAAQAWYATGSQLTVAVGALESVVAAADPDAAFLACITLEQAVVDGWFDFDPPHSLVTPEGNTADLLARLRQCADGLSGSDVVLRARLACASADASLAAGSSAAEVDAAFMHLMQFAGAGRYLHAGGLILARSARSFAMHGATARAIDLWRQAILLSSESRLYGDVTGYRRALNAAILEQPVPAFAELAPAGPMPNADRLLAINQSAELNALRAAQADKLRDAFNETRRYQWETRLSGHLSDERKALELFGDVLHAAGRPDVAVIAWVTGGASGKASALARGFAAPVEVTPWAASQVRAQQAAAAQVIGAQARLYGSTAEAPVRHLLALATGLSAELRFAPHPALDAVNALCRFGIDLPADAVEPVLALLEPVVSVGGTLSPETADLLVQLYWAVPSRRDDLAAVIRTQLVLGDPPPFLWEMIGNLPEAARGPVNPAVSELAEAGNADALRTLAKWREPTTAVQLAARRTCARLLRQPTDESSATWSVTTQFDDAVTLVDALASADPPVDVDPKALQAGVGPMVTEKILFSTTFSVGAPTADPGTAPPPPAPVQPEATAAEQAAIGSGTIGTGGQREGRPGDDAPVNEPDATQHDRAARTAAGPPASLAAAVAQHLLAVAEGHNSPAFYRAGAVAALHSLLGQLAPDLNSRIARHMIALAAAPALTAFDQFELSSQDPLSHGRLDVGARNLPVLALVTAATAAALAVDADAEVERLPSEATRTMIDQAVQLLHIQDEESLKYGATVLALVPKFEHGLSRYADALIVHPSAGVRAIAAAIAVLDEQAQRILAADSSPQVRVALASRAPELASDILRFSH